MPEQVEHVCQRNGLHTPSAIRDTLANASTSTELRNEAKELRVFIRVLNSRVDARDARHAARFDEGNELIRGALKHPSTPRLE